MIKGFSFVQVLIVSMVILIIAYRWNERNNQVYILNPDELSRFDGESEDRVYVAILGEVYDVTPSQVYHKGNTYSFFAGIDASRAFAVGKFGKEYMNDRVLDLEDNNIMDVINWRTFYREHEKYQMVGLVSGTYYDSTGKKLEALLKVEQMAQMAREKQQADASIESRYPKCNNRWTRADGVTVWCTNSMLEHAVMLVPRKMFVPSKSSTRCACVEFETAQQEPDRFESYPDCKRDSSICIGV